MEEQQQYRRFATSYALTAKHLYMDFEKKHSVRVTEEEYGHPLMVLYTRVLKYFFYLVVLDIIEKGVTFRFPRGLRAWLEMIPITGDRFKLARQRGAFDDVDYLASNFTGYQIYFRKNNRYGKWTKQLHISKKFKDRITELTNQGRGW